MIMTRIADYSDAERIAEIYSYYVENTTISLETKALSAEEMRARMRQIESDGYPWLVCVQDDLLIGYAYGRRFRERAAYDSTAEIAIYFDKDFLHCGLGTKLAGQLLDKLREYGYYTAVARIHYPNPPSQGMVERLGFEKVGIEKNIGKKFNKWLSMIEYTKPLRDYD